MISLYALWCGLCWRLRGGLISDVTHKVFGRGLSTGVTRIVCTLLMVAPLVVLDPRLAILIPSIFTAMTIPYFDRSMGLEEPWRDHLFLSLWGVAVAGIMLAPLAWWNPPALLWAPLGALACGAYAAMKPLGGKWTERAEVLVGILFGALLWGATHG